MLEPTIATSLPTSRGPLRSCGRCGAAYRTDFQRCPSDGTALVATASDPLVGTVIGEHYAIEELIGEGAMGRVYRAHHVLLAHKRFAVKVLIGDLAVSSAMRMRFAREAEAASRLEHPGIIGVHDFGRSASGLLYIVMELVEGETLRRTLARGAMSTSRVERLARQLCQGLAHAHARGVVHRDLKPDNIMIAGEVARIGDFGLALTRDDDARLTQSGIVCTPAYAAPEQLLGGAIDQRADLYALGVTLYEMLSGKLPFADDAGKKILADAPSVASVAPGAPATLVRAIGRLLERDPAKRPASAEAVLEQIDAGALEPTAPHVVPKPAPRSRLSTAGLAAKLREHWATADSAQRRDGVVVDVPGPGAEQPRDGQRVGSPVRRRVASSRIARMVALPALAALAGAGSFAALSRTVAPAASAASIPALLDPPTLGVRVEARATEVAPPPMIAVAPLAVESPARTARLAPPVPLVMALQEMPLAPASPLALTSSLPSPATSVQPVTAELRAPAAPVVVRAAARRTPRPHPVRLVGFAVEGSLSHAVIERAIARVLPELRACTAPSYVVAARFTIDDSRRATDLHVAGPPCVAEALAHVRTEVAPDIGDATVSLRFH